MAQSIGSYLLSKKMQHMIVHVTNACNFRCDHCFVDFETSKRDLKLDQFQKLGAESPPLMWLDIGGGEPFLRKDLADIVLSFDSKIVHIPTNGSLIPQMLKQIEKIQQYSDREIIIGLSLDGLQESHDTIRKQPGNWDQIWDAFEVLRNIDGVSVKVCTVIHRGNCDEIIPLMEEVYSRGVDFHSVILLRGDPLNAAVQLPSVEDLHKLGLQIFEVLNRYDYGKSTLSAHILKNFHRYLWNTSLKTIEQKRQVIRCLAGQSQLVVWGDGEVASCELLPSVGNIKQNSIDDIIASDAYRQQVKDIKQDKCHCTHNCAMLDSIFYNPFNLPNLLYQRVK